ncbi:acyl-CoA dehydrogenase family protein [Streptomyces sp. NPDC058247]|uniref:acyl-CoA dehydrogenase family protein n=1 Tax=Streptomyces sp. NPDC058247 TaxID=3346401 RepID=UPI0036E2F44F
MPAEDPHDDHTELRREIRRFLGAVSTNADVRRLMESPDGHDAKTWQRLATELGLTGLIVPERYGGAGAGAGELAAVMEEMGRALLCAPYFSSAVLAALAMRESGDEKSCADLLPGIADGTVLATLAVAEPGTDHPRDLNAVRATARRHAGGFRLTGAKTWVVDGHRADLLLVAARTEAGLGLFAVEGNAPGVERVPLDKTLDPTRKLASVRFDGASARLVGEDGGAAAGLERALDLAGAALAAEQVGGARRCLELSVDYAKAREQFGRPIGSFQAVKHKCAQMLLETESAAAAAQDAAACWDDPSCDPAERALAASSAQAYCSETYARAAAETVQIHGGIGFTWEHDAHLYLRRATASGLLLGSASWHLERVARLIGLAPQSTSAAAA